jgi:hypothetical protein
MSRTARANRINLSIFNMSTLATALKAPLSWTGSNLIARSIVSAATKKKSYCTHLLRKTVQPKA